MGIQNLTMIDQQEVLKTLIQHKDYQMKFVQNALMFHQTDLHIKVMRPMTYSILTL